MENVTNQNILFSRCCYEWLKQKEDSVKASSYYNYKYSIEKHILPILGQKTLAELEKYDFKEFIKNKKETIISSKKSKGNQFEETEDVNLKTLITKLKSILNYTTRKYNVIFNLDGLSGIHSNQNEVEIFSEKDFKKLSKYLLDSNNLRDLGVLISLYTGLRIGEVCGLKWSDINFEDELLYVNRTAQRVYMGKKEKSKLILSKPKTIKSKRKIPIAKVLLKKLKEFKNKYPPEAFVLTGETNRFYEPSGYRYDYRQVLKSCKIQYKNYHKLRHTFASRCIGIGMDAKSLSEVLGHSNIGITMNLYVHSSNEIKKKYINKL